MERGEVLPARTCLLALLSHPTVARIRRAVLPSELTDGSDAVERAGQRAASVLMPLVFRDGEWRVVFTQRPDTMPTHAGQISFPGGKREGAETALEAALRETREEIGVAPHEVEVIGRLPSFNAGDRYRVSPFIGVLNARAEIVPDAGEVAAVFETPLAWLMDRRNHVARDVEFNGEPHRLWDMPWEDESGKVWEIWGMTAMMLYRLWERAYGR